MTIANPICIVIDLQPYSGCKDVRRSKPLIDLGPMARDMAFLLLDGRTNVASVLGAASRFTHRDRMFGERAPHPMNLSKLEPVRVKLNPDRLTTGRARSVVEFQLGKGLRHMGDCDGESSVACDDHLFR